MKIRRGKRPTDMPMVIHKDAMQDGDLSLKARGALGLALSLHEGHPIALSALAPFTRGEEPAVLDRALTELALNGYLTRGEGYIVMTEGLRADVSRPERGE